MNTAPALGRPAAVAALALLLATSALAESATTAPSGELHLRWDDRQAKAAGPLAAANRLLPGIAPPPPAAATVEALLRHTWRTRLGGQPLALAGEALAWHHRNDAGASTGSLRLNELQLSAERGAWAFSTGKKVLGWDVGFGFRWITPVAPFRFEWAYPIENGRPGDLKFIFYLGY
jgi:hypothetical protein